MRQVRGGKHARRCLLQRRAMIVLLASAKTLDFSTPWRVPTYTLPEYLDEAKMLLAQLRKFSPTQIAKLMGVSPTIARLNADRYQQFCTPFTPQNAKPALLAYRGEVYRSMEAAHYRETELTFAHKTLRIVSGLYGVLRPLDLIQPYRLEMATKLNGAGWTDLYHFWSERVSQTIDRDSWSETRLVVNLASQEYFRTLLAEKVRAQVLTITFKQERRGLVEMVPILAKHARGLMARHIVTHRCRQAEPLKEFHDEGYRFAADLSTSSEWVFVRRA